jgi:predicted PurR-regulated permease PerM
MPSTLRTWRLPVLAFALLLVAYAGVIAGNFLLGVFAGSLLYLFAWVIDRLSPGNPLDDMTRARRLATSAVVLVVLAYAVIIAGSILLGVLAAGVVAAVSWITSPVGPVAAWLDDVR